MSFWFFGLFENALMFLIKGQGQKCPFVFLVPLEVLFYKFSGTAITLITYIFCYMALL